MSFFFLAATRRSTEYLRMFVPHPSRIPEEASSGAGDDGAGTAAAAASEAARRRARRMTATAINSAVGSSSKRYSRSRHGQKKGSGSTDNCPLVLPALLFLLFSVVFMTAGSGQFPDQRTTRSGLVKGKKLETSQNGVPISTCACAHIWSSVGSKEPCISASLCLVFGWIRRSGGRGSARANYFLLLCFLLTYRFGARTSSQARKHGSAL